MHGTDDPTALTNRTAVSRVVYLVMAVSTLLGVAHHVDHVVRGNHVGWPITSQVTPFTYSLVVYPLIAVGLALTLSGRAGNRYWAGFFACSAAMLAYFHVSPWAVEPPGDVILPYADPAVGYLAFAVLLALVASVCLGSLLAAAAWYREAV
ncbi:hypothetical protein [Haloarcula onubensis]|uniref:Uncharacterized protein n=1 Tax=Haloarcula onubensis TaxID=2950539 RepID=A0ABU2FP22_9EURY|nr:hypothetical protein [Halomicroarcula sp. S3CR25-11]MDS0282504.1 hypothetical protein [Halomicroarcula sp. S3CR25-11]